MFHLIERDTVKWLLPILATVCFGAGGIILAWAKDWSVSARKARIIDHSLKRVDFWAKWLTTVQSNQISVKPEQVEAAHAEISRVADVVNDAFRFWPLPRRWSPKEYKARLAQLSFIRRALMLYQPYSWKVRLARIMWYGFVFGTVAVVANDYWHTDMRPDSTIVYEHYYGNDPTLPPLCPPDVSAAECEKGFPVTLRRQRVDKRLDAIELILVIFVARMLFSIQEQMWIDGRFSAKR